MDRTDNVERAPSRDWRVDMLVEDRHGERHPEVRSTKPQGVSDVHMERSSPESGSVSSLLGFLSTSPAADNVGQTGQTRSSLQPAFSSSALEEAASRWLQQTFVAEGDQRSHKGEVRSFVKPLCFLPEGLTIDVHGAVLGVSRAVQVFRGMFVILYTAAQVVRTLSNVDRVGNHASLAVCNVASFLCYPAMMLACGFSSYEKFLRDWPDPSTYHSGELMSAFLLPLVSAWISNFAFYFLSATSLGQKDATARAAEEVLLFASGAPEGVEILLATSVNFAIVFVFWRPVAGLLHTVKARVWHDVLALALALSPLALMFCMKTLSFSEDWPGMTVMVLPYLLHVHLGILGAACWDRLLSQLRPLGFHTLPDSTHLLPWDVFKGWLVFTAAAWWAAFVLFAPLGQVVLVHDFTSRTLGTVGPGHPTLGFPLPLQLLASVWPLAACMVLCGLLVTLRHFNAVVWWMDSELAHIGQNLLYYLVVINIFLASLQRSDSHRALWVSFFSRGQLSSLPVSFSLVTPSYEVVVLFRAALRSCPGLAPGSILDPDARHRDLSPNSLEPWGLSGLWQVLEDARQNGGVSEENPIVVAGYSHGCVIAHQMACQLEEDGISAGVILFDLEVTWPPPATNSRVGGYSFLGGEAEAILLISRAFGKFEFAMKEAVGLNLEKEASNSIDVDALRQRAFEALNQKGLPFELFANIVKRSGMNIERLHYLGNPWEPPRAFAGPALMVVAPDSPEFSGAQETNAKYCKQMEAVTGKGSHYNMLQGEQAVVQAGIVHQFRQRLTPTSAPPRAGRSNTVVLRPGSPGATRIYAVHGLDGDVMSDGSSYATLAKYLDPCRVCALVYEEEAYACDTVPALAACYNRRVLEDARRNGGLKEENPILVAGYSHGCVVAHQMACQLEEDGVSVGVILFDLEVTWPPPATNSRVGGYSFLGGEAEAILLISRAFGKFEFAMKEAVELNLAKEASQSIDVDALRQRAFEALNQKGLPFELFAHIVKRSGMNIERLHYLGNPWEPFASAREINAKYCKQMEAVTGKGSHYNMLQAQSGEQAVVQAGIVHQFRQRLTSFKPDRLVDAKLITREGWAQQHCRAEATDLPGSAGATRIYAVHGLDGDVMSDGSSYATLAKHLDPCRVCALVYEEEAYACDTVPSLAACYNRRVLEDARRNGGLKEENPILVAGAATLFGLRNAPALVDLTSYSHGCVVAHQMACQLEEAGISVGVILFDLEVTWPPPATNSRVGGYSFLGGEAEAILLISRAFGKFEFAMKAFDVVWEAVELNLAMEASQSIDVDALRQRAFEALNQKGLPYELFAHIVKRSGMNIERLHYLGNPWEPSQPQKLQRHRYSGGVPCSIIEVPGPLNPKPQTQHITIWLWSAAYVPSMNHMFQTCISRNHVQTRSRRP
ncbi:Rad54b [Symbiodinium natans]|uniref:Rad54b protein n=1 Tax=Symbiodinium natans TaxID=878477 RepID=A0A812PY02_9DINO|nr:Rad54b [Symbiodinium natans]